MKKVARAFLAALIPALLCWPTQARSQSSRSHGFTVTHLTIRSESGALLPHLFVGLPRMASVQMKDALVPRATKCPSGGVSSAADGPGFWQKLFTQMFAFNEAVKAQPPCPSCGNPLVECTGFYMYPIPYTCTQGCLDEAGYNHYTSLPGWMDYQYGYCYTGTTTCNACEICRERSCLYQSC